ncbi:MAG: D-alanyl-D-alanine carboxypeptidase [Eubacterium sp.]|nr:D-alanyl-D-alanine carboxypeptidase [Eubacterium sp.]
MKKIALFVISAIFLSGTMISAETAIHQLDQISAYSAILMNADTGTVVFEKSAYQERAMASTTKIMSTLLTLEAGNLDAEFKVDDYAIRIEGTSMGLLPGDIVTRRALCYGMMLPSGNDAANAAAVSVAGNIGAFVDMMNNRAAEIGMNNTHFANPSGLDANRHYSTAFDMAKLIIEALKNSEFGTICGTKNIQLKYGNPPYLRWLSNNNKLLDMYDGCIGGKTGYTIDARRCLITAAQREGVTLIAVTLNAGDDWNDHIKMYDYGYAMYDRKIIDYDVSKYSVDVVGGEKDSVPVELAEPLYVNLLESEMAMVEIKVSPLPFLYGGFEKGEFAGNLVFYYNGSQIKSAALLTVESCKIKKEKLNFFEKCLQYVINLF